MFAPPLTVGKKGLTEKASQRNDIIGAWRRKSQAALLTKGITLWLKTIIGMKRVAA